MNQTVTAEEIAEAIEQGEEAVEAIYARLPWVTNWAWSARVWDRGCDLYDRRMQEKYEDTHTVNGIEVE